MPYLRSDQAEIHVESPAVAFDKDSWDMLEGADPVAEATEIFPGGMANQVALGGLAKWSPGTIERAWSESLALLYKQLANGVGSIPITFSYILLGANKIPLPGAAPFTYNGVLASCERPKYEAKASAEAMLKITVSINGQVA